MSSYVTDRPRLQLVGDAGGGYCDPESGFCVIPATHRIEKSANHDQSPTPEEPVAG